MAGTGLHIEEMKRYIGFGPAQAELLRSLAEPLGPYLAETVNALFEAVGRDETAAAVLEGAGLSADQLRAILHKWLGELFGGDYGQAYWERRADFGRAQVRAQLPQQQMCAAVSVVRRALTKRIRALGTGQADEQIDAVGKLLDLELAAMLETFRAESAERIRAAERAAFQKRLDESEHMANVGQLAATLAHEIKNPLAGISGAVQVLGGSLPPGSPHQEVVAEILSEIDRLDATARDLLIYARPKPPQRKMMAVGPLLQRILTHLRNQPAVQALPVRCDGLDCAAEAYIDETQFRQVITNLLLNAAHACENGGEVTFHVLATGDTVRVEVTDTGVGIPADKLDQLFEPFYTTKAKGTGLGLPICKWIVESHGGRISLKSEQGRGTTVTLQIPGRR